MVFPLGRMASAEMRVGSRDLDIKTAGIDPADRIDAHDPVSGEFE